jgi:hypothetical protein
LGVVSFGLLLQEVYDLICVLLEPHVQCSIGFFKHNCLDVVQLEGFGILQMIYEAPGSREEHAHSLPQPHLFVVGLLAANEAPGNYEGAPFETSHHLIVPLDTQLSGRTNYQQDSPRVPLSDSLPFEILVDEGYEVGEGFAAPSGGFGDDVLPVEDGFEALDLNICEFADFVSEERAV